MKKVLALVLAVVTLLFCLIGCDNSKDSALTDEDIHTDYAGVYLTISSLDSSGEYKKLNAVWHNETFKEVTYGEGYNIEYLEDGEWKSVLTDELIVTSITNVLKSKETKKKNYSTELFDLSNEGTYRLISDFSLGDGKTYNTWVTFEVKNTGNETNSNGKNAFSGEMPKNTSLEFWITEDVKDYDWTGHDEIYGWMGAREFLGSGYKKTQDEDGSDQHPEHYVSYVITAWPDYADGGEFVTDITVTDPAVTVYGLTVASTYEDFDAVFEQLGFELSWSDGAIVTRVATRDGITFCLTRAVEDNPNVVPVFRIAAELTNRDGIVF
ncbi:MAG: hypothetical protein IJX80_08755 [Clostridia bacterium]|nr:hypothetical protein [Clostridia bacterium]